MKITVVRGFFGVDYEVRVNGEFTPFRCSSGLSPEGYFDNIRNFRSLRRARVAAKKYYNKKD